MPAGVPLERHQDCRSVPFSVKPVFLALLYRDVDSVVGRYGLLFHAHRRRSPRAGWWRYWTGGCRGRPHRAKAGDMRPSSFLVPDSPRV